MDDNKQRKNTREENDARDLEIYRALADQNQPVVRTKGSGKDAFRFRFVEGLPDQWWVRDGEAIIQDNSFWRALSQSHAGTSTLWPIYKYQTSTYLNQILDLANTNLPNPHPRAILYTVLNGHAGGRTSTHLARNPPDLIAQTNTNSPENVPVSSELFQVVADLYSVELLVFYLRDHGVGGVGGKGGKGGYHGVVARGQSGYKQLFLSCYIPPEITSTHPKPHYQPILPSVPFPQDFKFSAHMQGDKTKANAKRCPFIFGAGKVGEKIMPGIPEAMARNRTAPEPVFPKPVPVEVGREELKEAFWGYRGPAGEGGDVVLGLKGMTGVGGVGSVERKGSVKRGTQGGRARRDSFGDSTESSRRRTSVSTSSRGKTSARGRSRTPSVNSRSSAPAAGSKVVVNRARSGSSARDSTESSRRRTSDSVGSRGKGSVRGRSRTPSVTASSTPMRKASATPTPTPTSGKNSSISGRSSVASEIQTRTASIRKCSRPPPPPPSSLSTKTTKTTNPLSSSTSIPNTGEKTTISLPSRTRTPSISKVPAPPSSTRKNSFSRIGSPSSAEGEGIGDGETRDLLRRNEQEVQKGYENDVQGRDEEEAGKGDENDLNVLRRDEKEIWENNGKPVIDPRKPPPAWANKNIIGYGNVPGSMRGGWL